MYTYGTNYIQTQQEINHITPLPSKSSTQAVAFENKTIISPQSFDITSSILISVFLLNIFLLVKGVKHNKLKVFIPFAMLWIKHKTSKEKIISTLFFLAEIVAIIWVLLLNPDLVAPFINYFPMLSSILTVIAIWFVLYVPVLILNIIYMGVKRIWD